MTAAQQRKAQRRVHLTAALLVIAYLYAPLEAPLQDAVRFFALPRAGRNGDRDVAGASHPAGPEAPRRTARSS
jgi:hypothetical protein